MSEVELDKEELDRAIKVLEHTKNNLNWIAENFSTLKLQYSGEYVAVCNNEVVASGTRRKSVQEEALREIQEPDCITIKKIEPKKRLLIL